jgi:hypothetical protein
LEISFLFRAAGLWTESLSPREALKALRFAHIAQSVEHFLGKEEVTGSNPVVGSRIMGLPKFAYLEETF